MAVKNTIKSYDSYSAALEAAEEYFVEKMDTYHVQVHQCPQQVWQDQQIVAFICEGSPDEFLAKIEL